MKVSIVGSINTDITVNVDQFARPNETVIADRDYIQSQGGKGANQAAAAASAGVEVLMIARVGDDDFGERAIESLEKSGVDCNHVSITPGAATGLAAILVDGRGDNIISVASGANARLSASDVAAAHDAIARSDALVVQLEVPIDTVAAAIEVARANGVLVVLNPAPAPRAPLPFLCDVDLLVPNESEARHLARLYGGDGATPEDAARTLLAAGTRAIVVTLGGEGCLIANADGVRRVEPYRVEAVDTTGAGDTFCGFLASALVRGAKLAAAVDEASAAAALSVTRPQARSHLPTQDEVRDFRGVRN